MQSTTQYPHLLRPFDQLGLKNSIVMAPMTTCHADDKQIPMEKMVNIYRDRASVGLIIAEAACISWDANAYPGTPGIYTDEQVAGWLKVTEAVHEQGGKIFLQLWHAGPMGHSQYRKSDTEPNGSLPPSPSGVKPLKEFVPRSNQSLRYEHPKVMDEEDMENVKMNFVRAAELAKKANFDGVELHAASGYLLDSFLHCYTNKRQDAYGGTPEKMCRFVLDVLREVGKVFGQQGTAIRICPVPLSSMQNMEEHPDDRKVFECLLNKLNNEKLAYVHACTDNDDIDRGMLKEKVSAFVRNHYQGTVIGGGSYTPENAEQALKNREFSLIYWGRMLLANPGLVNYLEKGEGKIVGFNRNTIDNPPRLEI